MEEQVCTKCGVKKELSEFNRSKRKKNGRRCRCRECDHKANAEYNKRPGVKEHKARYAHDRYLADPEKQRQYQINHKEEANARKYKYVQRNPEKRREQTRRYYHTHKEKRKEYDKQNRKEQNRKKKEFMATHPQTRIAHNLRTSMWRQITGRSKGGRMLGLIGCEWVFFMRHIESQFTEGMTWDNYGQGVGRWSIDHIKPLISFDLTDIEQQKEAFNWTNCRPLWYTENASKSAKYNGIDYRKKRA